MSPEELKTAFQTLVDDEDLSDAMLILLFNQAKNDLELEAKPPWLITKDASKSGTTGDTYLTTKALPSDFRAMRKLYYGTTELRPVPFEKSIRYKDASNMYYIDHGNDVFAQTGSPGKAATYTMYYLKKSADIDDLSSTDNTIITWPEYQLLIAYQAAKIYQANIDADDLAFRMSAAQEREFEMLRRAFMNYCSELQLSDEDGTMGYADEHIPFDIGSM
jgi:hypothetical protein